MAKKKEILSLEEKLEKALVPDWEQPYKVPSNWVWTRVDEVCKLANGIKGNNGELPYLEVKYLRGKIDGNTKDKGNYIEKGSKVILVDGENSGEVFHIFENGYMGSTFKKLDVDKSVDQRMFEMFLATHKDEFRNSKTGSAIPHLNKELFRETPIPLPPLAEQKRIVERIENLFSKLDEAKELAQSVLDSFENRKSVILHKAFTGELTKKWREENRVGLESWKQVSLNDVGVIERGKSKHRPRNDERLFGGEYPFVQTGDIARADTYVIEHKQTLSEFGLAQSKLFSKGTLCITIAANIGDVAILSYDCCFPDSVVAFTPNKKSLSKFIYYKMSTLKNDIEANAPATAQKNINLKILGEILFPIPTIQEQKEIVRILDSIFEKETKAKECANVIEQIDLMKKAILARAFRGELGTNDEGDESAVELLEKILEEN